MSPAPGTTLGRCRVVETSVLALLLAACGTPTPAGPISPSPTSPPTPSAAADGCAPGGSRDWTTERSFSNGVVPRGDGIQLGLGGRPGASVRATVKAPDGSELSTTKAQEQNRGGSLAKYVVRYPADFTPAGLTGVLGLSTPGTYTVVWAADGAPAACDRFDVARSGVADAGSCAPPGWSALAPGSTLVMRSGGASMGIAGAQELLGIVTDPWYAFEAADRQSLTLRDGSAVTVIVSRSSTPKRVAALFRAGAVSYRFDASGETSDLVERSRDVIACAHEVLR